MEVSIYNPIKKPAKIICESRRAENYALWPVNIFQRFSQNRRLCDIQRFELMAAENPIADS